MGREPRQVHKNHGGSWMNFSSVGFSGLMVRVLIVDGSHLSLGLRSRVGVKNSGASHLSHRDDLLDSRFAQNDSRHFRLRSP